MKINILLIIALSFILSSSYVAISQSLDHCQCTLDQSYHKTNGRIITADNGAVEIKNKGGLIVEDSVGIGIGITKPAWRLDIRTKKSGIGLHFGNDGEYNKDGNPDAGSFVGLTSNNAHGAIILGSGAFGKQNTTDTLKLIHSTNGWQFKVITEDVKTSNFNFCLGDEGKVGVGLINPKYTLDVAGKVRAIDYLTVSDKKYKTNLKHLPDIYPNLLENVSKINSYSYQLIYYKYEEDTRCHKVIRRIIPPPWPPSIGFIAEEIEPLFPELVETVNIDDEQHKAINYNKVVVVLLEAIKELKVKNDMLEARIKKLEH